MKIKGSSLKNNFIHALKWLRLFLRSDERRKEIATWKSWGRLIDGFVLTTWWFAKNKIVGTFLPISHLCNCKLSLGASRAIVRLIKKSCDVFNQYLFKRAGIDYETSVFDVPFPLTHHHDPFWNQITLHVSCLTLTPVSANVQKYRWLFLPSFLIYTASFYKHDFIVPPWWEMLRDKEITLT